MRVLFLPTKTLICCNKINHNFNYFLHTDKHCENQEKKIDRQLVMSRIHRSRIKASRKTQGRLLLSYQIPDKSSCCCCWWWHTSDKLSSMSREEEFRSVPRAIRGKRSAEMRAQKQVISGQSVKSNAISVVWEQPKMLLPMLSLMFFISSI